MADKTDDKLDALLGELAAAPPFPVDWEQYERELMQRIWRQQAERFRRTTWVGVASALAGAAATFIATVTWMNPDSAQLPLLPQQQNNAVLPVQTAPRFIAPDAQHEIVRVVRHEDGRLEIAGSRDALASADKEPTPFSRRGNSNGRPFQISFSGFTPEGADRPGLIEPAQSAAAK